MTVHFDLRSRKKKLEGVRAQLVAVMVACQDLPLDCIMPPKVLTADEIAEKIKDLSPQEFRNLHHYNQPDEQMIAMNIETVQRERPSPICYEVFPEAIIWSTVHMLTGCEGFALKLVSYPSRINVEFTLPYNYRRRRDYTRKQKQISTGLGGWRGGDFCKTVYASVRKYGGLLNFLSAHLTLVKIMEEAQRAGLLVNVHDEGDFWEHRDLARLSLYIMGEDEPLQAWHLDQLRRRFDKYGLEKVPELDADKFEPMPDLDRLLVAYKYREAPRAVLEGARQHARIKVRPADGGSSET